MILILTVKLATNSQAVSFSNHKYKVVSKILSVKNFFEQIDESYEDD